MMSRYAVLGVGAGAFGLSDSLEAVCWCGAVGWTVGFEPTNTRATTWRLRPLGDAHHAKRWRSPDSPCHSMWVQSRVKSEYHRPSRRRRMQADAMSIASSDALDEERGEAEEEEEAEHVGGGRDEDAGGERGIGAERSQDDGDE